METKEDNTVDEIVESEAVIEEPKMETKNKSKG